MLERIFAVMLVGAVLPCFAQHGPIGRAIKSTQVTADPSEMEYTTNTVVQEILEDISDQFGVVDDQFGVVDAQFGVVDATFMKGTNIANAAYDPATLTWGGLGNMPGTNIVFSRYSETNKTWTPVQYHADSYFFWAGNNGGKTGNPVKIITEGAAVSFNSMHDYITATNIYSDAGGWMDLSTGVVTLPVTGLYDVRYSCVAKGASVMLGYILNGGPGAHPRGGGWAPIPGQSATTFWAGYDAFQEGDEIEFVYYPSVELSSDAFVSQFFIYVRLVGPFPTGDFMSFREFNEQ